MHACELVKFNVCKIPRVLNSFLHIYHTFHTRLLNDCRQPISVEGCIPPLIKIIYIYAQHVSYAKAAANVAQQTLTRSIVTIFFSDCIVNLPVRTSQRK